MPMTMLRRILRRLDSCVKVCSWRRLQWRTLLHWPCFLHKLSLTFTTREISMNNNSIDYHYQNHIFVTWSTITCLVLSVYKNSYNKCIHTQWMNKMYNTKNLRSSTKPCFFGWEAPETSERKNNGMILQLT